MKKIIYCCDMCDTPLDGKGFIVIEGNYSESGFMADYSADEVHLCPACWKSIKNVMEEVTADDLHDI